MLDRLLLLLKIPHVLLHHRALVSLRKVLLYGMHVHLPKREQLSLELGDVSNPVAKRAQFDLQEEAHDAEKRNGD